MAGATLKKKGILKIPFFSNCKLGLWDRKPLDASHGLLGWVSGSFWRPVGRVPGFLEGLFVPPGRLRESPKASWGDVFGRPGATFGSLGGLVRLFGGLLRPPGGLLSQEAGIAGLRSLSWAAFQAILGLPWAALGLSWAVLGPYWPVLGPSWGSHGRSWSCLGDLFGPLGALEARKREKAKNLEKTNENQRFVLLRTLSERLSGLSRTLWEGSWEPGAPSEGCLGLLGSVLGRLFAFWGVLGVVLGRPGRFRGLPGKPGGAVPGA